jgi:hypothetical protein
LLHLLRAETAYRTARQIAELEWSEANAMQRQHRERAPLANASNLTILSINERELENGAAAACRTGSAARSLPSRGDICGVHSRSIRRGSTSSRGRRCGTFTFAASIEAENAHTRGQRSTSLDAAWAARRPTAAVNIRLAQRFELRASTAMLALAKVKPRRGSASVRG